MSVVIVGYRLPGPRGDMDNELLPLHQSCEDKQTVLAVGWNQDVDDGRLAEVCRQLGYLLKTNT